MIKIDAVIIKHKNNWVKFSGFWFKEATFIIKKECVVNWTTTNIFFILKKKKIEKSLRN